MPSPDLTIFGSIVLLVVIEIARFSREIDLSQFPDIIGSGFTVEMILHRFVWFHFLNSILIFYTIYLLLVFDNLVNRLLTGFLFAVWIALPALEVSHYHLVLEDGEFPDSLAYQIVATSAIYFSMLYVWDNVVFPLGDISFWSINIVSWAVVWLHAFIFLLIVREDFEGLESRSSSDLEPRDL